MYTTGCSIASLELATPEINKSLRRRYFRYRPLRLPVTWISVSNSTIFKVWPHKVCEKWISLQSCLHSTSWEKSRPKYPFVLDWKAPHLGCSTSGYIKSFNCIVSLSGFRTLNFSPPWSKRCATKHWNWHVFTVNHLFVSFTVREHPYYSTLVDHQIGSETQIF
jgi:hypothetical protein